MEKERNQTEGSWARFVMWVGDVEWPMESVAGWAGKIADYFPIRFVIITPLLPL